LKLDGIKLKDVYQKVENDDSLFYISCRSIICFLQKNEKLIKKFFFNSTKNAVLLKKFDLESYEMKIRQAKNIVEFVIFCSGESLKEIADKHKNYFIIDLNFRAGNGVSVNFIFKNAVIVAHESLKMDDNFAIYKLIKEKINNIDRFILYKFF
jgi:hypothetical protein